MQMQEGEKMQGVNQELGLSVSLDHRRGENGWYGH